MPEVKSTCCEQLKDDELVELAQGGSQSAFSFIINKYKGYVITRSKSYYLMGADDEDIIQEGMIGLFKAIRDFKPQRHASFKSFAELCITRQMITAIKTANRQKHIPLNSYISLNGPAYDDKSDKSLIEVVRTGKNLNPEELMINRESVKTMGSEMSKVLSHLELSVLSGYIQGKSYQEMAADLGKDIKSVDNAIQRIKKKTQKVLKLLENY